MKGAWNNNPTSLLCNQSSAWSQTNPLNSKTEDVIMCCLFRAIAHLRRAARDECRAMGELCLVGETRKKSVSIPLIPPRIFIHPMPAIYPDHLL
jgi:hypothetical protein